MAVVSEKQRKNIEEKKENPEKALCSFEDFDPMLFIFLPVSSTSF